MKHMVDIDDDPGKRPRAGKVRLLGYSGSVFCPHAFCKTLYFIMILDSQ
jgi:hypothetical protein